MTQLILIFIGLSIANVIMSTAKSIITIKCGKWLSSFVSGIYFSFYNIMLIYTVAEFPMWQKCLITFVCNVIGVWVVKLIEEKLRKSRLWKVELTIRPIYKDKMESLLKDLNIPYNWIDIDKYFIFNAYCATEKESAVVKTIANECRAKYFVSESKIL